MTRKKRTWLVVIAIILFLIVWYGLELPDTSAVKTVIYGIFILLIFVLGIIAMSKSKSEVAMLGFFMAFIAFDNNNLWLPIDNKRVIFEIIRIIIFLMFLFSAGAFINKKLQQHNPDYKRRQ